MITVDQIITGIMQREDTRWRPGMADLSSLLVNHPADRGGATLVGATYRDYGSWKFGRPARIEELEAATEDDLRAFYAQRYVAPFDFVPEPLKLLVIDWGVTSGPDDPIKAVQRSLRARGLYAGAVDGVAGARTRAAVVNDSEPRRTYRDVFCDRVEFYIDLGLRDARINAFLKMHPDAQLANVRGWVRRALEFALWS